MKDQQIGRKRGVLRRQVGVPTIPRVRLGLPGEQLTERTGGTKPGKLRRPQMCPQRGRERVSVRRCADAATTSAAPPHPTGRSNPVRAPRGKAVGRRLGPPAHDDDRRTAQDARPRAARALRDWCRGRSQSRWRRPRCSSEADRARRPPALGRGSNLGQYRSSVNGSARCPVVMERSARATTGISSRPPARDSAERRRRGSRRVDGRGDAHQVDAGPAEQHGKRAGVVRIATDVRIQVDTHRELQRPAPGQRLHDPVLKRASGGDVEPSAG